MLCIEHHGVQTCFEVTNIDTFSAVDIYQNTNQQENLWYSAFTIGETIKTKCCTMPRNFIFFTFLTLHSFCFRFPSQITQTRCMCTECFDYNWVLQDDLQYNSEPIYVSMPVIRFEQGVTSLVECNDSNCKVDFVNVTVGCQCVIRV